MPIYEYRCEACGAKLEKIQKFSDPVLVDCPECGEARLKKLISAAAFRLKGSGWYETDFKSGNKKNVVGEGKSESSSDGKSSEGNSSDSKSSESKSSSGKSNEGSASSSSSGGESKSAAAG